MWELDCEEGWEPKNWCFWTVVLEKTLEGPLDYKEIQPVHSEGDQPWDFFGRNDAKAETPVLWPPHAKSWFIGKDSDAGRDWGQEEKGMTEDEMAWWHHWLDGCESEWTPEVGDGQGGLACCDSWGCKESDMTERLNWTELNWGSAAAVAKSLQSCPTLCNPIDGSPPGSPIPEILQAWTLEWVAISLSNAWKWKVKVKSPSHVWLLVTPWTSYIHFLSSQTLRRLPMPNTSVFLTPNSRTFSKNIGWKMD